ncbi:hypothetical protein AAULR_25881, partial [Lacticaseibacillus rhamnosus MTCC 5462]
DSSCRIQTRTTIWPATPSRSDSSPSPWKEDAISINTIRQRVASQGIDVSIKTIQRDIVDLALQYPQIRSKPMGKANLWWAEKSLSRLYMLPTDAM